MTKRYLFLNSSLTNGGSERVMTLIANYFAETGHEVSMLLLREKASADYQVSEKLRCIQLHYPTTNKMRIFIRRYFLVRKYIRELNPDTIIAFMWDINIFTILACLGLHKRVVISERAHPRMGTQSVMRKFGQRYLYRLADQIVLQTEAVKQFYIRQVQRKCTVIPNPINQDIPRKWSGPREKVIVAAGRLTAQKNFAMLLRAFARFHKLQENYKLIIYGEGELKESLQAQARDLCVDQFIDFPGYVSDVNSKMRRASMYVSSSDYEGISNSMLEALAMGIPSICTDCPVGGAALAIKNNINGLLIPVGDEGALVEAMCKVAGNTEFSNNISDEATKIGQLFSIEQVCAIWEQIL